LNKEKTREKRWKYKKSVPSKRKKIKKPVQDEDEEG
jgi:hypothetical protein